MWDVGDEWGSDWWGGMGDVEGYVGGLESRSEGWRRGYCGYESIVLLNKLS